MTTENQYSEVLEKIQAMSNEAVNGIVKNILEQLDHNSKTYEDSIELLKTCLTEVTNGWKENYNRVHNDYVTYSSMCEILISEIAQNDLDVKFVEAIQALKEDDKPIDDDEYATLYSQETYNILIQDIKDEVEIINGRYVSPYASSDNIIISPDVITED